MAELADAIAFAAEDALLTLGDRMIARTRGLPMGGSFSEPLVLVDAAVHVNWYDGDVKYRARLPTCNLPGRPRRRVCSFLHVNDHLLTSGTYCVRCLGALLQSLLPSGHCFAMEEMGNNLTFAAPRTPGFPPRRAAGRCQAIAEVITSPGLMQRRPRKQSSMDPGTPHLWRCFGSVS